MRRPTRYDPEFGACPSEASEQERVVTWWRIYAPEMGIHPNLLWHCPNGGQRNPVEGAHFKRLGVVAGVPDLFIAVPVGKFHGLFVEMKRRINRHTANAIQKEQMLLLEKRGYCTLICHGADAAIQGIEAYLSGGTTKPINGLERVSVDRGGVQLL